MIPTDKLKEFLEKAGKATPGPWRLERDGKDDGRTGEGWPLVAFRDCSVMSPPMHADRIAYHGDDAAFIAEANPATLQSIIRELLAWREWGGDALTRFANYDIANPEICATGEVMIVRAREALARIEEAGK